MGSHSAKSRQGSGGVWTVICSGTQHFANLLDSPRPARGLLHTEEVTGSIPVSPTRSEAMRVSIKLPVGAIPVSHVVSEPVRCRPWWAGVAGAKTASTSITRGSAATLRPTGIVRVAGVALSVSSRASAAESRAGLEGHDQHR
jgi:hypothetical protein